MPRLDIAHHQFAEKVPADLARSIAGDVEVFPAYPFLSMSGVQVAARFSANEARPSTASAD